MAHNSWLNDNSMVGEYRGDIRIGLIVLFFVMLPCRAADSGLSIPVVLYTNFRIEPPPAIMESIRNELEGIISPMAIHVEWRSISEGSAYPEAKPVVVNFKGRCDVTGSFPVFRNGGVL